MVCVVLICRSVQLEPEISESPESLLVPVNTNAMFRCQAYCVSVCDIDWIINGVTANPHQRTIFKNRGFTFFGLEQVNTTYTVRLAINASANVNDTELWCNVILDGDVIHAPVRSSHAKLLVIRGDHWYKGFTVSLS